MERKELSAKALYDIIKPITVYGSILDEHLDQSPKFRAYRIFKDKKEMISYVDRVVSTLAIEGYDVEGLEEMIIDLLKEGNKPNPFNGQTVDFRPVKSKKNMV